MKPRVSDYRLNAFVDGELPAADAALVAEAVAADPALARRVLRLHQMKGALAGLGEERALPPMPPVPPVPTPGRVRRGRLPALSAAAALVALALLMLASAPVSAPSEAAPEPPRLVQHDRWLAVSPADALALDLPDAWQWMAPIMQASRLQLVHLARLEAETHFGFKGPNACRVSLFVTQSDAPAQALSLTLSDAVQQAHWQVHGLTFQMVARDMAPARFATVATGLHEGSEAHAGTPEMRLALMQSARLPCLT